MRWMILAVACALAACSDVGEFYCDENYQCELDGEQGTCTPYGLCAFHDATCPTPQLRYHESAGELADVCVGQEEL